jgi:hypothetical protein
VNENCRRAAEFYACRIGLYLGVRSQFQRGNSETLLMIVFLCLLFAAVCLSAAAYFFGAVSLWMAAIAAWPLTIIAGAQWAIDLIQHARPVAAVVVG